MKHSIYAKTLVDLRAMKEDREALLFPDFSAHNLCHTFCTCFCENETNLKVIQDIMGHADISTTMDIYAETTEETDVFDFAPKPPIKWDEVKEDLANNGAAKVIHVQAKRSIEDWFLYDIEGILGFLRLGKNTKVSGKNGYDKLQRLYKQANKVYYKGIQSNGMIEQLISLPKKVFGLIFSQTNNTKESFLLQGDFAKEV